MYFFDWFTALAYTTGPSLSITQDMVCSAPVWY